MLKINASQQLSMRSSQYFMLMPSSDKPSRMFPSKTQRVGTSARERRASRQ